MQAGALAGFRKGWWWFAFVKIRRVDGVWGHLTFNEGPSAASLVLQPPSTQTLAFVRPWSSWTLLVFLRRIILLFFLHLIILHICFINPLVSLFHLLSSPAAPSRIITKSYRSVSGLFRPKILVQAFQLLAYFTLVL